MPLVVHGRTKDALVIVPVETDWRAGVVTFLEGLGGDAERIERHIALLDERAAGRQPWATELAGRTLPNGRAMPPGRAYAEMLINEDLLPLYDVGGFPVSLDLHNPANEAGVDDYDPTVLELAIVADVGAFTGATLDSGLGPEVITAQRAAHGATLGVLVASLADAVRARFAYADISTTGWRVPAATRPESVVHPSSNRLRAWDFLWSINVWDPELVGPDWPDRLARLALDPARLAEIDRHQWPHVRLERRRLDYGGYFLQYRFLFGAEGRGDRAHLDTPLASQLGLRSTNLQLRA